MIKRIFYLLIPIVFVCCGPSRSIDGSEIPKSRVWDRIRASKNIDPKVNHQLECPQKI